MYVAVPAGVDGHCSQETTASQPAPFEAPFEVNLTVKQPVLDNIVGGIVVPEYVPICGEATVGPS